MAGTSTTSGHPPESPLTRTWCTFSRSASLLVLVLSLVLTSSVDADLGDAILKIPATSSPAEASPAFPVGLSPIHNGLVARSQIPADADVAPREQASVNAFATAVPGADPYANYSVTEEVCKPISVPVNVTPCIVPLLQDQNFSAYYAPVNVTYTPPPASTCGSTWQLVVLSFSARVRGVQYDRRFTFTLADFLFLKATTAQPTQRGVKFSVERDVTVFRNILARPQKGVAELPNPVSADYDGVYYVTLQLKFYPGTPPQGLPDVVLPAPNRSFRVPRNVYKAKLELHVSHFQTDEYYYLNVPNSFYQSLSKDDQSFISGNGSCFREVVVFVDRKAVGVIFPKPVMYSGFINPQWWMPFMGIGSLNMPLYSLDLTPVLSFLLDGRDHSISMAFTNSARGSLWFADGALLAWTDPARRRTTASLTSHRFSHTISSETISSTGSLNAIITTTVSRRYSISGIVTSSFGTTVTRVSASLLFKNTITYDRDGLFLSVNFNTTADTTIDVRDSTNNRVTKSTERAFFPIFLALDYAVFLDTYGAYKRVTQSFFTTSITKTPLVTLSKILANRQAQSSYFLAGKPLYLGSGGQRFNYTNNATNNCYARDVLSLTNVTSGRFSRNVAIDVFSDSC